MTITRQGIFFLLIALLIPAFAGAQADSAEGYRQWIIAEITIEGNNRSRRATILREIPFKEGDTIYIDSGRSFESYASGIGARLMATGLFHTAGAVLQPQADSVNLRVRVDIFERGWIAAAPIFRLTDRNFNQWLDTRSLYRTTYGGDIAHINLTGRGDALKLKLLLGWRETVALEYSARRFAGRQNIGFVIRGQYERGHEVGLMARGDSLVFLRNDDRKLFEKVEFRTLVSYRQRIRWFYGAGLGLDWFSLDSSVVNGNREFTPGGAEELTAGIVTLFTTYDGRDHFYYPLHGAYLKVSADYYQSLSTAPLSLPVVTTWLKAYAEPIPLVYGAAKLYARAALAPDVPYVYESNLGFRDHIRGYERYFSSGNFAFASNNEMKTRAWADTIQIPWLPFFKNWRSIPFAFYPKVLADIGFVGGGRADLENLLSDSWLPSYGVGFDLVVHYNQVGRLEYSRNRLNEGGIYLHFIALF